MQLTRASLMAVSLGLLLVTLPLAPTAQAAGDPAPGIDQWTEAAYTVTLTSDLATIDLAGSVDLHEIDPPPDMGRACSTPCTADALRELYENPPFGASQEDIVDAIEDGVRARAQAALTSIAGQDGQSEVVATLDRSTIESPAEGDGFQPPIVVDVVGSATNGMLAGNGYSGDQVQALLELGARFNVPIEQQIDPGANLTLHLAVPSPLGFPDPGSAERTEGAPGTEQLTWTVTAWQEADPDPLTDQIQLGRTDVVVPQEADLDVTVTMDLSRIDPHYGNILGDGPAASLHVALTLDGQVRAVEAPALDESIELPFLSADGVRIAMDEGLVSRSEITSLEGQARVSIRTLFEEGFGQPTQVHGGFLNETLAPSAVGDPPGTGGPIVMDMNASAELAFPPEETPGDASAFEITRVGIGDIPLPQLDLPGNPSITYLFILPPGTELVFEDIQGATAETVTTEDGQSALQITSEPGQEASLQGGELVVEHPLIWHVFWPVILLLVLLLVVLPGAIIATVIYRRRRRRREEARARRRVGASGGTGGTGGTGDAGDGGASGDAGGAGDGGEAGATTPSSEPASPGSGGSGSPEEEPDPSGPEGPERGS